MRWPEPIGENQNSLDATWACASYAVTHAIESKIQQQTGKVVNLSARFIAKLSGTVPGQGNYLSKIIETIQTYGIVEDKDWPQPAIFTNAEYYKTIPQEVIDKGKLWDWEITDFINNINASQIANYLNTAPLVAWVPALTADHFVEVLDTNTRFDSFPPYVRPLGSVQKFYQVIIKRKDQMILVKDGQTYYLEGNKGYFGINKPEFLNLLIKITDQVEDRPPVGQQLGVVETVADVFQIKKD